jgi:hypothetical protein
MVKNTTLAVFALIAALGLVTAILVVEPIIPRAVAQGPPNNNFENRLNACEHPGSSHVPFC